MPRGDKEGDFGLKQGKDRSVDVEGSGVRGRTQGSADSCVCPKCGKNIPYKVGTPCYKTICPKCGSIMRWLSWADREQ